jgi:hypothetical protein
MAIFQITPANSVVTTAPNADAFFGDTPAADALIVDAGAYLRAEGSAAFGAFLDRNDAWTVQVNGLIRSAKSIGVNLEPGNGGASTITVGAGGEIHGGTVGIYGASLFSIVNAGTISGANTAIDNAGPGPLAIKNTGQIDGSTAILSGQGADTITNSGFISGHVLLEGGNDQLMNTNTIFDLINTDDGDDTVTNAKLAAMHSDVRLGNGHDRITNAGSIGGILDGGAGNDAISNSGTIGKDVTLGSGLNTLTNTRLILGNVIGGADRDVVKNTGIIEGIVDLGGGDDLLTGGNQTEIVVDSAGADTIKLGGGTDHYYGVWNLGPAVDGLDVVDGGAGIDVYNAASATDSVYINLDKVAHDFSPFMPGAGAVSASTATGIGLTADRIVNFEYAQGGAGSDIIYGSASANVLLGNAGFDTLAGFAGNDVLHGGDGGDALWGGAGKDVLSGGTGADFFQFAVASETGVVVAKRDVITDFETGFDLIDLRAIDANTKNGAAVNDAFSFIGADLFSGVAGQLRIYAPAGMQIIEGDLNGDKKADFAIEVTTTPATLLLTATDFLL